MRLFPTALLACLALSSSLSTEVNGSSPQSAPLFGFRDSTAESSIEAQFLSVPDPKLAAEHLRILTQAPHMAGTPEDKATADYVAQKFRDAGLDTEIVEYTVWMNYPREISVDTTAPSGVAMHGPRTEHVDGDPFDNDPRVVTPFHSMSPSGDVDAPVVYANYGRPEDFKKLEEMKIDVRGKIVLMRYGQNFRGVKVLDAQEHGAAGVLIYSDPYDDGWRQGDKYPAGPWRPDSGVQRGSVGFMFEFPGDPTTPGVASLASLPEDRRTPPQGSAQLPKISSTPLCYADAWPILQNLGGPDSPREWQGSLPFTYHVGPGPVKVHLRVKQDYQYRTIWDVIGRVRGSESPDDWVITGNHRDAWVYGAVDPNSGTAAMLEAVHGVGELLKSGWKPKRTLVFGSWDGEEEGLIGSTEWAEQNAERLSHAVAYFNVDVAVSGPKFGAAAVPSLNEFLREVTKFVSSPHGGTVYDAWQKSSQAGREAAPETTAPPYHPPAAQTKGDVSIGDLGSGSDYTAFLQHLGVPATDIGSTGSYGVYHSVFDNLNWFKKFADPDFLYEQQMARVLGLEAIRMADADVLPFDYEEYAKEVEAYVDAAQKRAQVQFGAQTPSFAAASDAAKRFEQGAEKVLERQRKLSGSFADLNQCLRDAERALLLPEGLPNRPWYRHAIYAPGRYTGYAAVVIPGVNEAIDKNDAALTEKQIAALAAALDRTGQLLAACRY